MANQTFSQIVEENFDEIHKNFRIGLKNKGYSYIEDLMNDAFINCNLALHGKKLSKKEAIKYYWAAYINKYKTFISKDRYTFFEDMSDFDHEDDEYNDSIDEIYNIIIDGIRDKYGVKKAYIWEMYVCYGKSSKELRKMGFNVDNFVYFNKQVKRYIRNHIIPNNKRLQELIKYRKFD
jgi:hypothetical protein